MDLINIIIIIVLIALGYNRTKTSNLGIYFLLALILKIIASMAVVGLYFYYYGYGDTILYFEDGKLINDLFRQDWMNYFNFIFNESPVELYYLDNPRALFFIKIVSPIFVISNANLWIISIYIALISFYSCWYLAVNISNVYPKLENGAVLGLLFYPSIVFWSSGLQKESIALVCIVILTSFLIQFKNNVLGKSPLKEIVTILLFIILFNLKYYYAAAYVLVVLPTVILQILTQYRIISHPMAIWVMLFLIIGFGVSFIHPNLNLSSIVNIIFENNQMYREHHILASSIDYYEFNNSLWSMLINAPIAFFSILFRPFFFEASSWLQLLISIENGLLLVYCIAWFSISKKKISFKNPLIIGGVIYVVLLAVFLALSTPNFGTLSRYRISFLPILIILLSYNNPVFGWLNWLKLRMLARKSPN